MNLKRRFAKALQMVDLALDEMHLRGLDVARNIAKLLPWCPGPSEVKIDETKEKARLRGPFQLI